MKEIMPRIGVILASVVTAVAVAVVAYEVAKADPRWVLLVVFLSVWGVLYREISRQSK